MLKPCQVCYGEDFDDIPEDSICEYNGQSADLNHQFGGKYVAVLWNIYYLYP